MKRNKLERQVSALARRKEDAKVYKDRLERMGKDKSVKKTPEYKLLSKKLETAETDVTNLENKLEK